MVIKRAPTATHIEDEAEYSFLKNGNSWVVIYDTVKATIPHSIGMEFIACLLEYPGKLFPTLYLSQMVDNPDLALRNKHKESFLDFQQQDQEKFKKCKKNSRNFQMLESSEQDIQSLQKELEMAEEELETALGNGETERIIELQEEVNNIKKIMRNIEDVNKKAYTGYEYSDTKKVYTRIHNSITRAYEKLEKSHPKLHLHLKNTIHTATNEFYYSPENPKKWNVQR